MTPDAARGRLGAVRPFIALDIMERANRMEAAGREVLHLEVGQPSTPAPAGALAAAGRALGSGPLGYTETLGSGALRERIAAVYRRRHGVEVDPGRVAVTTGSSAGFILGFLAAFEAGARVAVAEPGYPAYRNILNALGLEAAGVPVSADGGYRLTPEALGRLDGGVDGAIVASPANPTGAVLPADALRALVEHCAAHGVRLVSDEVYHGITYGAACPSALEFGDDAIVVNSFSKYHSMTGWRIGWAVLPEGLRRPVELLAQNLFIAPPTVSQHAALAALDCGDELDANVARYAANREILLRELPAAGIGVPAPPDGAFYVYADLGRLTNDSARFCEALLEETGVAIVPGTDFDRRRGHTAARISFAGATETVAEAARRIREWTGRSG